MRYVCLSYADERRLEAMAAEAREALQGESRTSDGVRHLILRPTHAATTVRVRGGRLSLADGSAAEALEQLASILLLEARDLNEAIRIAARLPAARVGSVEIRPVRALRPDRTNIRIDPTSRR